MLPIPEAYIPPALNLDIIGKPLPYRSEKNDPDRLVWERAEAAELIRLLDTKTIVPIKYSDIPEDCLGDIVYYNPVVKQKRETTTAPSNAAYEAPPAAIVSQYLTTSPRELPHSKPLRCSSTPSYPALPYHHHATNTSASTSR